MEGSRHSFGKTFKHSHLLSTLKYLTEARPCRPYSILDVNLSQSDIEDEVRLEGRPCIGDVNSGQPCSRND